MGAISATDFGGVSLRRMVPNRLTSPRSRQAIGDTSTEFLLDGPPDAEHGSYDGAPRAVEANGRGAVVGE